MSFFLTAWAGVALAIGELIFNLCIISELISVESGNSQLF